MNAPTRLAGFGLVLAVALGGGAVIGAAVGPVDSGEQEADMSGMHGNPGGGYRLEVADTSLVADQEQDFTFRVVDGAGETVTEFDEQHERRLHLMVVSNDLVDFAHLHPTMGDDGEWTVVLPALSPGGHRVIADIKPAGEEKAVLTVDLIVPGVSSDDPLPPPTETVEVDGLAVTLETEPDDEGLLASLTVRRDGEILEPDPYLGARGHLVAIDVDDLAYLHVHPEDEPGDSVPFAIADPTPGRYRLFFDFSLDGDVHTASFTLDVTSESSPSPDEDPVGAHS